MRIYFYFIIWLSAISCAPVVIFKYDYNSVYGIWKLSLILEHEGNAHYFLPINLQSTELYFRDNVLKYKTKTNEKVLQKGNLRIMYRDIDTEITFGNIAFSFSFHNLDKTSESDLFPEGLSFGFNIQKGKEKFMIIENMLKENVISNKRFGFLPHTFNTEEPMKGNIFFGGIPREVVKNFNHSISYKISSLHPYWGCYLNKVYYYNEKNRYTFFPNRKYIYFQTNDYSIRVPRSFLLFLKNNHFAQYIDKNECAYQNIEGFYKIVCEEFDDLFKGELKFVLGKRRFDIPMRKLFHCFGYKVTHCEFLIQENVLTDYMKGSWVFGTVFMENYLMLFDYEDKSITFYSKNKLGEEWNEMEVWQNKVFLFLIVIQIFCILLLISHFSKKQSK